FSEGLGSNTRGTGASEKGSSEIFGRRNRRGSSPEEGDAGRAGRKTLEMPGKMPGSGPKLAQLRLTGETCGRCPAARRRRPEQPRKVFSFSLEPARPPT